VQVRFFVLTAFVNGRFYVNCVRRSQFHRCKTSVDLLVLLLACIREDPVWKLVSDTNSRVVVVSLFHPVHPDECCDKSYV